MFLLILNSLASKLVFVIKFACANLAVKLSAVSLLNSGVVIYLSWLWLVVFFSNSVIYALQSVFLTKPQTLGILFSTTVNAEVVAKPLIFGLLFSISLILEL